MDLVLVISTSVAAIAAFLIGYIYGKMKQADKDKRKVYDAMSYAHYKIDEMQYLKTMQANHWEAGASDAYQTIFRQINNVFYFED